MLKTKKINPEKIFKFLWPDRCWHKVRQPISELVKLPGGKWVCKRCELSVYLDTTNPDLSTPDGMVMILDRLVEMGYRYKVLSGLTQIHCEIFIEGVGWIIYVADTAPLAVLNAVQALMEKEEKE